MTDLDFWRTLVGEQISLGDQEPTVTAAEYCTDPGCHIVDCIQVEMVAYVGCTYALQVHVDPQRDPADLLLGEVAS